MTKRTVPGPCVVDPIGALLERAGLAEGFFGVRANVYIQTNAGLTYLNGNSALFNSFNQFQIKAVLQSNSSAQVPLLQSVQGLALMV